MRPKLLKSFILVVGFWWLLTTLYWSVSDPVVVQEGARRLLALLPFVDYELPVSANVLNSLSTQLFVLRYWSFPIAVLTALSFAAGTGYVWLRAKQKRDARDSREQGNGKFRGITCSRGVLPLPEIKAQDPVAMDPDAEEIKRLSKGEIALLEEIVSVVRAGNAQFAGHGVTEPLDVHVAHVIGRALEHPRQPGLSAIVAAAHEMGKLTSYKKGVEGQWVEFKSHDKEAARILATLSSWWDLPHHERLAVLLAVKFRSKPWDMPVELEGDAGVYRTARDLLDIASGVQEAVVAQEVKKVLERTELPDMVFDAFVRTLPQLAFQSRGLPKGVRAVAWKQGSRVYMLEIALREAVMKRLTPEIVGALKPAPKERPRLQPFTQQLLGALSSRGWLVTAVDAHVLAPAESVWTIQAGKLEFKGVLIVDVPDEYIAQLPNQDSMYELKIVGPMFSTPGQNIVTADELGDFLSPAPKKPAAEQTEAGTSAQKDNVAGSTANPPWDEPSSDSPLKDLL